MIMVGSNSMIYNFLEHLVLHRNNKKKLAHAILGDWSGISRKTFIFFELVVFQKIQFNPTFSNASVFRSVSPRTVLMRQSENK